MEASEKLLLDQTTLYHYIFDWDQQQCCMAMGFIPVYNHARPSNCEYFQDYIEKIMYVKTVRAIEADEELTLNYNGDWDHPGDVWFELKS